MTEKVYDPGDTHPPKYQKDLNPDAAAGVNYGTVGPHPEKNNPRTAHDVKEAHELLADFTDDLLKQIPILPEGARLEQDATYIDLAGDRTERGRGSAGASSSHLRPARFWFWRFFSEALAPH